jgi:hypothetical protein
MIDVANVLEVRAASVLMVEVCNVVSGGWMHLRNVGNVDHIHAA